MDKMKKYALYDLFLGIVILILTLVWYDIRLFLLLFLAIFSSNINHAYNKIKTNKEIDENTKTNNKNFKYLNEELDNLAVIVRMIKSDISLITTQTNLVTKRLENKINQVNENCLTKCLNIDSKYKDKLDNVSTYVVDLKVKFDTILTNLNVENGKFTEINNELCRIVGDIERIKKERGIEQYEEDNI